MSKDEIQENRLWNFRQIINSCRGARSYFKIRKMIAYWKSTDFQK